MAQKSRLAKGRNTFLQHKLKLYVIIAVTAAIGQGQHPMSSTAIGNIDGLGYKPAIEGRGFTVMRAESV